jgi:hypothetical protein
MKIYNKFYDKFNHEYNFDNYIDFAKFWFSLPMIFAIRLFPDNYQKLQNYAYKSKEARTKV